MGTELLEISYDKQPMGFGKPVRVTCPGIKFDDGQIAYLDADKVVRSAENSAKLKKALENVVIEVVVE